MVVILLWMFVGINSLIIEKGDRLMLDYSSTASGITEPILTYTSRSALSCFVQCLQMSCDSVIYCGVSSTCSLYRAKEHILNVNDTIGSPDTCTYIRRKNVCENGKYENGTCIIQYTPFQTLVSDSYTLMFESGSYNTNDLLLHRNVILGYKLGLRLKVGEMIIFSDGTNFTRFISPTVIGMGSDFIQEQIMYLVLLLPDKSINSDLIKQNEILTSNGKKISFNSSSSTPNIMETSLQWYMKQPDGTVECHSRHPNGEMNGTISDCITAIHNGAELYVVTPSLAGPVTIEILNTDSLEYSFPLHLDFDQVKGEDFKPYNDYVSWSVVVGRSNEALITRATVRMTANIPYTMRTDEQNVQYFINTDWYLAYAIDYDKQILSGSIHDLINAVLSGSRVRVMAYTDRARLITTNALYVNNNDNFVESITLGYPHTNDIFQTFRPALRHTHFQTNGETKMCIMEVGNPTVLREIKSFQMKSEWFVESRPWTCVMKTDENQAISFGSIGDLKQAVLSQKDFRLIISMNNIEKLAVDVTEARFYEDGSFVFQFGPITLDYGTCFQGTGVINETMIVQIVGTVPFDSTNSGIIQYINGAIEWYIN